jgi:hypothetical protein
MSENQHYVLADAAGRAGPIAGIVPRSEREINRSHLIFLRASILAIVFVPSVSSAQESRRPATSVSDPPPANQPKDETWLPEFLKRLPHPPDEMRSLYQPAPATSPFTCAPTVGPYFESDPLLDPPHAPQPGCFYSVELEAAAPHIFKAINGSVVAGSRGADTVELPNHGLNWTVAPKLEVGYRLPSGFGGFSVSYRWLNSSGDADVSGPDGIAPLHSRLALNVADFDYQSWEYMPNDRWTMRWRFGGRLVYLFYDSKLNQAFDVASTGSGVLGQHASNMFYGFGPHASLELTRQLGSPEWRLLSRLDFASVFGRIKQNTSEVALDSGSPSGMAFGEAPVSASQTAPMVNWLFGLNWRPAAIPGMDCFIGYQGEYWWNVGRFSGSQGFLRSRGDMSVQGIVAQIRINY